jgi:LmbE family N-acetylglucosaminyl deacetylase
MRLLAVFSHPDDELGCLGTLAKHAKRGDEVMLVWTTHGELASQFDDHSDAEVRRIRQEHGAWVADTVGAKHHFFDMGDSRMTGERFESLQLAKLYAHFQPDAVLTWSDDSPHPDHRMTAKITVDAITLARIPKILNEGQGGHSEEIEEMIEAHRQPVRLFQYVSSASARPVVHIDIGEEIELVKEVFSFYQEFYGWSFTPEDFLATRAAHGRESGVRYAEKLQRRQAFAPALGFLI